MRTTAASDTGSPSSSSSRSACEKSKIGSTSKVPVAFEHAKSSGSRDGSGSSFAVFASKKSHRFGGSHPFAFASRISVAFDLVAL